MYVCTFFFSLLFISNVRVSWFKCATFMVIVLAIFYGCFLAHFTARADPLNTILQIEMSCNHIKKNILFTFEWVLFIYFSVSHKHSHSRSHDKQNKTTTYNICERKIYIHTKSHVTLWHNILIIIWNESWCVRNCIPLQLNGLHLRFNSMEWKEVILLFFLFFPSFARSHFLSVCVYIHDSGKCDSNVLCLKKNMALAKLCFDLR